MDNHKLFISRLCTGIDSNHMQEMQAKQFWEQELDDESVRRTIFVNIDSGISYEVR